MREEDVLIVGVAIPVQETAYYRLKRDLLTNYQPDIRPVKSPKTPTNVTVSMYLYEILNVVRRKGHDQSGKE